MVAIKGALQAATFPFRYAGLVIVAAVAVAAVFLVSLVDFSVE